MTMVGSGLVTVEKGPLTSSEVLSNDGYKKGEGVK